MIVLAIQLTQEQRCCLLICGQHAKLTLRHEVCAKSLFCFHTTFLFFQLLLNRQQRFNPETRAFLPQVNAHQAPCVLSFLQWIPFLMFETLNSCRRKLVCAKIMPNVGKNLSWCALLPNFKKNQKRKLVCSQIHLDHFPHLRGQLWGVTTSQIHSLLSVFWHVALHRWGTIAYC